MCCPALTAERKPKHRRPVVALGKALAVHDALPDQLRIRAQEAIGGDELHLGRIRPAGQQRLQHARRRRLAGRDRPGDPDDVRDFPVGRAEEALRRLEQPLRRRDIEREQPRQRQIDGDNLVERDGIVGRLQLSEIVDRERQLGVGAQLRPFVAGEAAEWGLERLSRDPVHQNSLTCASRPGWVFFRRLQFARDAFSSWPLRLDRWSNSSRTDDSATPRARSTTRRW